MWHRAKKIDQKRDRHSMFNKNKQINPVDLEIH